MCIGKADEGLSVVISAIFIIALVFTFGFRLVGVSGSSMVHTLSDGDWLIVTPYYSEPEYGDIVISTHRLETMGPIVKRVIATEGQTLKIYLKSGEEELPPITDSTSLGLIIGIAAGAVVLAAAVAVVLILVLKKKKTAK